MTLPTTVILSKNMKEFSVLFVDGGMFVGDSDAMLFNLSCQRHFPNKGTGDEIWCNTSCGPNYGWGELAAYSPFNGQGQCESCTGYSAYGIPEEGGKNALTNQEDRSFTITELEVWSIKEEVRKIMILIDIGKMKLEKEHSQNI